MHAVPPPPLTIKRLVAVAPMMDWSDRHFRYLIRLMTKHTLLYTEMVTTQAILRGDRARLLAYDSCEHPLALQLGGSDPQALAQCTEIANEFGFDEINLNVGCPSTRVQAGQFGACLMQSPELVARCCEAMQNASSRPITVKCRTGVDEMDSYSQFRAFIETVAAVGVKVFIIHARKAWLQGLSPKQNRSVPPLCYEYVTRLKQELPELTVILNGGLTDVQAAVEDFPTLDGFMFGRAAYHNPYLFATVDTQFYGATASLSRADVVVAYTEYLRQQMAQGVAGHDLLRHCLSLYRDCAGAKRWRQYLSRYNRRNPPHAECLLDALHALREVMVDTP
jgi:tRNA-dihydrouridine synthase A